MVRDEWRKQEFRPWGEPPNATPHLRPLQSDSLWEVESPRTRGQYRLEVTEEAS